LLTSIDLKQALRIVNWFTDAWSTCSRWPIVIRNIVASAISSY
jgi:hypothetical protein